MDEYGSRSHTKWEYKSRAVFIPKLAEKLFKGLREQLAPMSCRVAEQKERWLEQGHVIPNHVRRMLSVPPKLSASHVAGGIQGKRAPDRPNVPREGTELRGAFLDQDDFT